MTQLLDLGAELQSITPSGVLKRTIDLRIPELPYLGHLMTKITDLAEGSP